MFKLQQSLCTSTPCIFLSCVMLVPTAPAEQAVFSAYGTITACIEEQLSFLNLIASNAALSDTGSIHFSNLRME